MFFESIRLELSLATKKFHVYPFLFNIFLASDRVFRILPFSTDPGGIANGHLHVQHTCQIASTSHLELGSSSLSRTDILVSHTLWYLCHIASWYVVLCWGPDNSAVGCSSNRLTKNKTFLRNISSNKTSLNSYFFRIS